MLFIIGLWGLFLAGCTALSTPDPFTLEAQAQRVLMLARAQQTATAEAALRQWEREALLVAQTQAAQSNAMTATAHTWGFQQTQAAATVAASSTAVALAQVQARATATQQAQATQSAIHATETALALNAQSARLQREKVFRGLLWSGLVLAIFLALALAVYVVHTVMRVKNRQGYWIDAGGVLVFDTHNGPITLDPRRMFSPATVIEAATQAVTAPPLAPHPLLQERTTARAQAVELAGQRASSRSSQPRSQKPILSSLRRGEVLPKDAPWSLLAERWQGGSLPLGLGAQGLILANPETQPHLLIAGTTGSGKTRFGIRPIVAAALADGWQVLIFDPSLLDFLPFRTHPNAHLHRLTDPTQAIDYLQKLYQELRRRQTILAEAGVSTWGRLPHAGPRLLAVFDEFSNLADAMPGKSAREQLWRWARMIAAEGRKAGVHLMLALQDPTHKSIDLRIRRNATPWAFRLRDDITSRVVLNAPGAEGLPHRHFLTLQGVELLRGVAFAPGDEELQGFLHTHSVPELPAPDWLNAPTQEPSPHWERKQQIRSLHAQGLSLNEIQRRLFGFTGGAAYSAVKSALESSTTTRNPGNTA